jgi:hypothetical protein
MVREVVPLSPQPSQPGQPSNGALPLPALVIGPRLPEMQQHVQRNLREDRLILVRAVFERV